MKEIKMLQGAPSARTAEAAQTAEEATEWVLWSVRNDPDIDAPSGQEEIAKRYICEAIRTAEARRDALWRGALGGARYLDRAAVLRIEALLASNASAPKAPSKT